jgi:arginine exporter protein ArgO
MESQSEPKWIVGLQIASVSMIWVFVLSISAWILHLLRLSRRLHDVPSASVGISIVAIPVFLTGAAVLTYVFVGLRRGRQSPDQSTLDSEER